MSRSFWKEMREGFLDLLFPPSCAACGEPGYHLLCPDCQEKTEKAFAPQKFLCSGGNGFADEMICLFPYRSEIIRRQLLQMKTEIYDNNYDVFLSYFDQAGKTVADIPECDCITFCPRSLWNRRRHGFDQSEELAKRLSRHLGIPMRQLLKRRGFSFSQHRMNGKARWSNVSGKFLCTEKLGGEKILLVDDIVTTGATASEVARVLKKSGAMNVIVFSLAH